MSQWVLSIKTSLPNVCRSPEDLKTSIWVYDSFEEGKEALLNKLREFYIPDEEGFIFLDNLLLKKSRICRIGGKSGAGKSSLFANWIKKYENDSGYFIVYHRVGLGECGNNVDRIIERIDNEIDSRSKK